MKTISRSALAAIVSAAVILGLGAAVEYLWNAFAAPGLGIRDISYWQAVGFAILFYAISGIRVRIDTTND